MNTQNAIVFILKYHLRTMRKKKFGVTKRICVEARKSLDRKYVRDHVATN